MCSELCLCVVGLAECELYAIKYKANEMAEKKKRKREKHLRDTTQGIEKSKKKRYIAASVSLVQCTSTSRVFFVGENFRFALALLLQEVNDGLTKGKVS